MKKILRLLVTFLIIAGLAGAGYAAYRYNEQYQADKTWLDEVKLQVQIDRTGSEGASGRTVLRRSQQKKLVALLKTLPDPMTAIPTEEPPVPAVENVILLHFAAYDKACYTAKAQRDGAAVYFLILYDQGYYTTEISQAQFDTVNQTIEAMLGDMKGTRRGLRNWINWKPTTVTVSLPETGIRVLSQEEIYSITNVLRTSGITGQNPKMNGDKHAYSLSAGYRMDTPFFGPSYQMEEGLEKPSSVVTYYYGYDYIKLITFASQPNRIFVINDTETGLYELEDASSSAYQETMNTLLESSRSKLAG